MKKNLLVLAVVLTITACTTTPPRLPAPDPVKKWQQRQTELVKINDWLLTGRTAIINGDESWHLSMTWQRHADKYILDLAGPFGVGHARLTGTEAGVVLVDADQNHFYAESADSLLYETTGLRLPVQGMLYWMRGLADPNEKTVNLKLDEFGRLAQIHQGNWRISFKDYIDVAEFELPEKFFIDRSDVKVKIFVDNWNIKIRSFEIESQ